MARDGVRVSIYENPARCAIRFYKNAVKKFNGPYVKVRGSHDKLYFYPATPTDGALITDKDGIQIGRREYVDAIRPFEGIHDVYFDEGLRAYYIKLKDDAAPVEEQEAPKAAPKAVEPAKVEKPREAEPEKGVAEKLSRLMVECIDADDLAGAKALLKAVRAFGGYV